MEKSRGIILITVLLFLQILSLLGLCALQMALLEIKQNYAIRHHHLELNEAEYALKIVETQLQSGASSCLIPRMSTFEVISSLNSFATCTGNFQTFQYYYVIEFLGTDPCAYL